jgi:hypothetical protein
MRIHYSVRVTVARLEFVRSLPEGNILSVAEQVPDVPDLLAGSRRYLESLNFLIV